MKERNLLPVTIVLTLLSTAQTHAIGEHGSASAEINSSLRGTLIYSGVGWQINNPPITRGNGNLDYGYQKGVTDWLDHSGILQTVNGYASQVSCPYLFEPARYQFWVRADCFVGTFPDRNNVGSAGQPVIFTITCPPSAGSLSFNTFSLQTLSVQGVDTSFNNLQTLAYYRTDSSSPNSGPLRVFSGSVTASMTAGYTSNLFSLFGSASYTAIFDNAGQSAIVMIYANTSLTGPPIPVNGVQVDAGGFIQFYADATAPESINMSTVNVGGRTMAANQSSGSSGRSALSVASIAFPQNSIITEYDFTNVPSGSWLGLPAGHGIDFGVSMKTSAGSLITSIALANDDSFVYNVLGDGDPIGQILGNETLFTTNNSFGGVSNLTFFRADGKCLPLSDGQEEPLSATFNASNVDLTLTPYAFRLYSGSGDLDLAVGEPFRLQALVLADTNVSMAWQFNGVDIPNETNSDLSINTTATNAGVYRLRIETTENNVIRNWFGPESKLLVVLPLSLTAQVGTNGTTTVTASGVPGETFYLKKSSDLVSWSSDSTNVVPQSGAMTIMQTNKAASAMFWRAEGVTSPVLNP